MPKVNKFERWIFTSPLFSEYGVTVLNVEQLLHEAIDAFHAHELRDGKVR